jgi:hypothetical protein
VALHHGQAVLLGQREQRFVENRQEIEVRLVRRLAEFARDPFGRLATSGRSAGFERGPAGDAVEPRSDPIVWSDGIRLHGENEERRLKGVFRVLSAREHSPADPEYHRPVPANEFRERILVVRVAEPHDQFAVGGRGRTQW